MFKRATLYSFACETRRGVNERRVRSFPGSPAFDGAERAVKSIGFRSAAGRASSLLLVALLLVPSACGDSNTRDSSVEPPGPDTVLAIATSQSGDGPTPHVFRWSDGLLESVELPSGEGSAAWITYADAGEPWLSILDEGQTRLMRSLDDGLSFESAYIELPTELQGSYRLYFVSGEMWIARMESLFLGSFGSADMITELWASSDGGTSWEPRFEDLGPFGVMPGFFEFATRASRGEAYYEKAGEGGPPVILDLAAGSREIVEFSPLPPRTYVLSPRRYATAGDQGWVAGIISNWPDPPEPAVAMARSGESWTTIPLEGGSSNEPSFLSEIDFVDPLRGVACGLRYAWDTVPREVSGIGCYSTVDGGESWSFTMPLDGAALELDDVVYTSDDKILIAARRESGPSIPAPVTGLAILLVGEAGGAVWEEYPLVGYEAAELVRGSSATR